MSARVILPLVVAAFVVALARSDDARSAAIEVPQPSCNGGACSGDWYRGNVTVTWSVGCGSTTVSSDTSGQQVSHGGLDAALPRTVFLGYELLASDAELLALQTEDGPTRELGAGAAGALILDRSPFYAEGGGQIGDRGLIRLPDGLFQVEDTQEDGSGHHLHCGRLLEGVARSGAIVRAEVDHDHRGETTRHHSLTHILHQSLRDVLGPSTYQRGSLEPIALVAHFARRAAQELGLPAAPAPSTDVLRRLAAHPWPGNVRELAHVVRRLLIDTGGLDDDAALERLLRRQDVAAAAPVVPEMALAPGRPPLSLEEAERRYVQEVLSYAGGNKSEAARLLGIERKTLARKLKGDLKEDAAREDAETEE